MIQKIKATIHFEDTFYFVQKSNFCSMWAKLLNTFFYYPLANWNGEYKY